MKLRMGMSRVGALTGTPVVRPCAIAPTLQPHTHHEPLPIVVLPDSITPFAPIRRGSGIVLTGVRGVDGVAMVRKDFPSKPQGQREYLITRLLADDDRSTGDNLFVTLVGSCESIHRGGFAFVTARTLCSVGQFWRSPTVVSKQLGRRVRGSDILRQAVAAAARMHELGFAHNDIKPDNLLLSIVDGVPVIVLCDFGLSSRSDKVDQARGTDGYRYLYSTPITGLHTDFWALGLLSCHIAIGKRFIEAWDQVGIGQDGTTQSALHHLACA